MISRGAAFRRRPRDRPGARRDSPVDDDGMNHSGESSSARTARNVLIADPGGRSPSRRRRGAGSSVGHRSRAAPSEAPPRHGPSIRCDDSTERRRLERGRHRVIGRGIDDSLFSQT